MIGTNLLDIIRKSEKRPQEEVLQQIRKILDSNPKAIKEKNKLKQTAAHYAVKKQAFNILEVLVLEYDADLAVKDVNGKMPEDLTVDKTMHSFIVGLKKEIKRRKDSDGEHLCDLLFLAKKNPDNERYYLAKIKKRISSKREINEETYQGRTACHWAVILDLPLVLNLLVQSGGDFRLKDKFGKYPLDYAKGEAVEIVLHATKVQDEKTFNAFFTDEHVEKEKDKEKEDESQSVKKLKQITHDLEGLTLGKLRKKRRSLSEPLQKSKASIKTKNRSKTEAGMKKSPLSHAINTIAASSDSSDLISQHGEVDIVDIAIMPVEAKVMEAIERDDDIAVGSWLNQGENPNNTCHFDSRPYILHAFFQRATKCFLLLLLNEADISKCDNHNRNIMFFLEEGKKEGNEKLGRENLDFLVSVLNKVNAYINLDEIQKAQEKLKVLERQFNRSLIENGLNTRFTRSNCRFLSARELSDIIVLNCYPKQLVKRIYECCTNVKFPRTDIPLPFSASDFSNTIIGLLVYQEQNDKINRPIMILDILCHLYHNHFESNQKLMAIMLVKEMVKWLNFTQPQKRALFRVKIEDFYTLTFEEGYEDLNRQIKEIIEQSETISSPYTEVHHQINAMLNRAGYSGNVLLKEKIEEAVTTSIQTKDLNHLLSLSLLLANELRAFSLQFYQLVHPGEFLNKGWTQKNKEELSPEIVRQCSMFNNLVQFLKYEILSRQTENERAMVISLYIMTLEALFKQGIRDYNMAMALSAVLNDSDICRLKRSFNAVPEEILEYWEQIQAELSELSNYKKQREFLKRTPAALPFLGLYTRDITFIYDGNENKSTKKERYPLLGGVFFDLFQRQSFARTVFIQFKTNLPSLLKQKMAVSDSSLQEMSILLEPPVLYLTPDMEPSYVRGILNAYIHSKLPLKVQSDGRLKGGAAAVESIYEYIEDLVKKRRLKVVDANQLITLVCKAAGGENMGFNSIQYNLRLNEIKNIMGDEVRELLTLIGGDRVKVKLRDEQNESARKKSYKQDTSDKRTVTVAIEVTIKKDKKGRSFILRNIRNEEEIVETSQDILQGTIASAEEEIWGSNYNNGLLSSKQLYDERRRSQFLGGQSERSEKGKAKEKEMREPSLIDRRRSRFSAESDEKGKEIEYSDRAEYDSTVIEYTDLSGGEASMSEEFEDGVLEELCQASYSSDVGASSDQEVIYKSRKSRYL